MLRQALMSREALLQAINTWPRVRMAYLPTPLEEQPRLSKELGVRLLVKRDDLTGLAFGGNKARHMEFRIADALRQGCDVLVATNAWVSNNARMMAAAAARVGMRSIFVVRDGHSKPLQGNLLLGYLLGSELHLVDDREPGAVERYLQELDARLRNQGHKPYIATHQPNSRFAGTIAHLLAGIEIAEQLEQAGVKGELFVYLVAGTSMTGLAMAAKLLGLPWTVRGMYVGDRPDINGQVMEYARRAQEALNLPAGLTPEEAPVWDVTGDAYGVATEASVAAIKLAARTEGLFLDPNYTGKAFGGMVEHIRQGLVPKGATVVFVHTGGLPAIFADPARLTAPDYPGAVTP